MRDKAFLDTNLFVYMQSAQDAEKRRRCLEVIDRCDCVVSTQVANELSNVLLRKFDMPVENIRSILDAMLAACRFSIVTMDTIQSALTVSERYGYSYYDSLIIASAREAGCRYLFTEDMRDGQIIDPALEIVNIFKRTKL